MLTSVSWGRAFLNRTPSRGFGPRGLQFLSRGATGTGTRHGATQVAEIMRHAGRVHGQHGGANGHADDLRLGSDVAHAGSTTRHAQQPQRSPPGHEEMARDPVRNMCVAPPYHSWEWDTNENTNGLIRRLHPKQPSFADIGRGCAPVHRHGLNDRPSTCRGWSAPRE